MRQVKELHNIHGEARNYVVYYLDDMGWDAITNVPCPVLNCDGTLLWAENGNVPGYRICNTEHHRFLGNQEGQLIRDHCCER